MDKTCLISDILRGVSYPGRGIIVGKSADGKNACFAYFLTGRSANSRNRLLEEESGEVFTRPFDLKAVEDPSLIIYKAVGGAKNKVVVTNGDQTDTIISELKKGGTFESALITRTFEPDSPNFTPRISAELDFNGDFSYRISILKCADVQKQSCERFFFFYPAIDGTGHFISTYQGNGTPLPSFCGEPKKVSISSAINDFADEIWNALDYDNKIALYVRYISLSDGKVKSVVKNKLKGE